MPVLVGWIFRGISRVLGGFAIPAALAGVAWIVDALTGIVSGILVYLGMALIDISLEVMDGIDWGRVPVVDLAQFGTEAFELANAVFLPQAIAAILASAIARWVVSVATLGRF